MSLETEHESVSLFSFLHGFAKGYKTSKHSYLNNTINENELKILLWNYADAKALIPPIIIYKVENGYYPTPQAIHRNLCKTDQYIEMVEKSIETCVKAKKKVEGDRPDTIKRYNAALSHYASELHKLIDFKTVKILSSTELKRLYKKYKALLHTKQLMFKYYDDIINKPANRNSHATGSKTTLPQ